MRVTLKAALGVTVGHLVAGKVPDDQSLVATAREQHVGAILQKNSSESRSIRLAVLPSNNIFNCLVFLPWTFLSSA